MNKLLINTGLKYGIIGFILLIIAHIAAWQTDISLFLNPLFIYVLPLLLFVLGVMSQLELRKKLGGFIEFNQALVVFIITISIALLGALLINYLIFNIIDPAARLELQELAIQEALALMDKMGELFGIQKEMGEAMNEDTLRQAMDQQDATGKEPLGLIFSFITNLIMFTIGGLIAAAIIKRNPPIQFD